MNVLKFVLSYNSSRLHCHPFHTAGSVAWLPPSDSESHYWTRPERREGHGALPCWMAGWLGLQPAVTLIGGFKVWNVDGVDFCRMSWQQPDLLRLLSAIRILKPSCLVLSTAITTPYDTLKSPLRQTLARPRNALASFSYRAPCHFGELKPFWDPWPTAKD